VLRLNATDAAPPAGRSHRRITSIPLLGPRGEVSLLLLSDGMEMLVPGVALDAASALRSQTQGAEVMALPPFEPRRYYTDATGTASGLLLGPDRAAILGEVRRRVFFEEHGPNPQRPPLALALDRELYRRRPMVLARRDDGVAGVLVLDGAGAATAGVAELQRGGGTIGPVSPLAPWSTLTEGSDPRCRSLRPTRGGVVHTRPPTPAAPPNPQHAWRALLVLDPSGVVALDAGALPGVALGDRGMALVRWGRERVCLEAFEATASDVRRRGDRSPTSRLIARWSGAGRPAAALVSQELSQGLACSIRPPPAPGGGEARGGP
jgi:hypothetical protein